MFYEHRIDFNFLINGDYAQLPGDKTCYLEELSAGREVLIVAADGSVVYGTAVAADTGVRGNIVDLYYDTYQQCINFGRRTCNVYILE